MSNPDVNDYPLEVITVPTLLVHAQDDPLTSYDAAELAAGRIPGARLVVAPSGGHLLLGQDDVVRSAISAFLAEPVTTPHARAKEAEAGNGVEAGARSVPA